MARRRARLATADETAAWRAEASRAVAAAEAAMRRSLAPLMAASGLSWDDPVSARSAALWSPERWADVVDSTIRPVIERLAADVWATVSGRVHASVAAGVPDPTDKLAALVLDRTLTAGDKLGARLGLTAAAVDERYGGVTHEQARPTIHDEYQTRFVELDRLASRAAGHLSDAAAQLLAEGAADRGPGVQYVWNSVGDDATRPDHEDADGQTVSAGDTFTVGGEELLYPGDPAGSDEQIDNCRCWLEIEGVDLDRDFESSLAADAEDF